MTYSFNQLLGWKENIADQLLQTAGVTFIDVDQTSNKVLVGVPTDSDVSAAVAFATGAGIPTAAFHTAVVGRPQPSHGGPVETQADDEHLLSERFITTFGGIMVRNGRDSQDRCSLMLGVTMGGAERYVTAAHCPWTDAGEYEDFASLDTTLPLYQARTLDSDRLGYEVADPASTCNYNGGDCRWADAALFGQPGSDNRFRQGWVTTTESSWADDPNTSVVHNHTSDSVYVMTGEGGEQAPNWPVSGQFVIKVGFITGRSHGRMVHDCVDMNQWPNAERGYVVRCQAAATYWADGGDSGGPVFASDGSFFGLHMGSSDGAVVLPSGYYSYLSYYSPIENIEFDLGAMSTEGEEHLVFHIPHEIWASVADDQP